MKVVLQDDVVQLLEVIGERDEERREDDDSRRHVEKDDDRLEPVLGVRMQVPQTDGCHARDAKGRTVYLRD